jgi:hypothetical protein
MSLLGNAAVAMWWNIRAELRSEFADWHSHEHFPERMSIPGFQRGSRWTGVPNAEGFFVLYELDQYETLTSSGYLDRLNNPTPWSAKMMPHHLNMVRSQCRITASFGGGVATSLVTVRLSPEDEKANSLRAKLVEILQELASGPGLTGGHLLTTDTPKTSVPTIEQKIRGSDAAADWIVLLSGYDQEALKRAISTWFALPAFQTLGVRSGAVIDHYRLAFTMMPSDLSKARVFDTAAHTND